MDGARIEFDLRTPLDNPTIAAHIAHSTSLGLLSISRNYISRRKITLVASGPSAITPCLGDTTAAVNNALQLFGRSGPTFWLACDPQEMVADFIPDDPPTDTIYLVATKCHPRVFEKLQDRQVRLFQVDDHEMVDGILGVPTAVSITLCAINLLAQMGYTEVETFGWDGCYIDGLAYARQQPMKVDDVSVDLLGRKFATTTAWACEAEDARAQMMRDAGHYRVTVKGGGMIGAILKHFGLGEI